MSRSQDTRGEGGELHQLAADPGSVLTTNFGIPIADDQNSLTVGPRGPLLLEDFHYREKIMHFDHERIPERVVHARGSAAHGYFQPYRDFSDITRAKMLRDPSVKTPVFVRFSTVLGNRGSKDTSRDIRGFSIKFYTEEGNWDMVGNDAPVFFVQDAIKFPDLIHSAKPEGDREMPQASTAHDTYWDFISVMPESLHAVIWAMSERGIVRSYRMMEGFGVNTFQFVTEDGKATFIKIHVRPILGCQALLWDEAVKISGSDPDFHRRDLWDAIESGNFPEYEFSVQLLTPEIIEAFPFDILDASKLIPEEICPLTPLGKIVLNRNPVDFFSETEQVAFCPANVPPGVDFSNDPLLTGRLFSYLDTQLTRLGGPNFHEIPINRPRCPMRNFQREGFMRQTVGPGRFGYEPSMLGGGPRECPRTGFRTVPQRVEGEKVRQRPETFKDHYSQARQFWISQTKHEQDSIVDAFSFELGRCRELAVRRRMLGHLDIIHPDLGRRVAEGLGMQGQAEQVRPAAPPQDLPPAPSLRFSGKSPPTLMGRKFGVLVGDGADMAIIAAIKAAAKAEGAIAELVALRPGGAPSATGEMIPVDHSVNGGPSWMFDVLFIVAGPEGGAKLAAEVAAVDWAMNGFVHLKVIGYTPTVTPLLERANVMIGEDGVLAITGPDVTAVTEIAKAAPKVWARDALLHPHP